MSDVVLEEVPLRSSFSWLDFSEQERRKALDVIDMFRDRGTVDELGLGTIRDALANILFPGTSTIQTRARYFLFIPWIYRALESRDGAAMEAGRLARKMEMRLITALVAGGERDGVVGIDARETLKRLPSNVYWQGLRIWGIRAADVSQADYHRNFRRFGCVRGNPDEDELAIGGPRDVWHANLPDAPDGFMESTTFRLTRRESEYLQERLMLMVPQSFLAWLVDSGETTNADFPWLHPQIASLPDHNVQQLEHARKFSLALQGAALAYNLYLSELTKGDELVAKYEKAIHLWAEEVESNREHLQRWSREEFWRLVRAENPRIGHPTWAFVERWVTRLLGTSASLAMIRDTEVRQSIIQRELSLKRKLARLVYEEPRSRWKGDSGSGRMDFRWFRTQVIVNDILAGRSNA